MNRRKWTAHELDRLHAGLKAGVSVESLAQELGRTPGAIATKLSSDDQRQRSIRKRAVERLVPRSGHPWSQEETASLVSGFKNGTTIEQLVRVHQRSTAAVMSKLVALDLVVNVNGCYGRKDMSIHWLDFLEAKPLIHWHDFVDIDERVFLKGNDEGK